MSVCSYSDQTLEVKSHKKEAPGPMEVHEQPLLTFDETKRCRSIPIFDEKYYQVEVKIVSGARPEQACEPTGAVWGTTRLQVPSGTSFFMIWEPSRPCFA